MMCSRPPVSSQSSMFRAIAAVSAAVGWPGSPSRSLTDPSCIAPLPLSEGSSQCSATISPSAPASVSALRIRLPPATGLPSSLRATQPASASSLSAASCVPARPAVVHPTGRTRTRASCAMRCSSPSTAGALSGGGSVFGIAQTVVNPPRSAASVSVAIVPFCSKPGSRRCACRSMNPGATMHPAASTTSAPSASRFPPTPATRPSSMRMSPCSSRPAEGSISRPPRIRIALIAASPSPSGRGWPSARPRRSSPAP